MIINGVIFLGSVILYKLFMSYLLVENTFQGASFLLILVKIMMTAIYQVWILIVYIMAMTLTTFWA